MLLQNAGSQLFRKPETFPIGSGENKQRHNSNRKNQSTYEQEIPSWRSLIHHRIRAQQSGLS